MVPVFMIPETVQYLAEKYNRESELEFDIVAGKNQADFDLESR